MSKVLIDRELLEFFANDLALHGVGDIETAVCIDDLLAAPSGTPAMPIKAYYHEAPNEHGGLNKSVGLEVRRAFIDAPLVLESDALVRIACLEGEIAKRDETIARLEPQLNRAIQANYDLREELAACRVAVESCELFRARIAELERELGNSRVSLKDSDAGLLSFMDQCKQLRAELAAIKAQEPIAWYTEDHLDDKSATTYSWAVAERWVEKGWPVSPLYAAPVSEAKAQGVVMPPSPYMPGSQPTDFTDYELGEIHGRIAMWEEVKRLNAAPVQQVSVPDGHSNQDKYEHFLSYSGLSDNSMLRYAYFHGADDGIAAPAAPAADAGLVDMYRHLQTVTPYRFKKIQDASVTDGGDVLYFHKDRFDAALLADMAAHRAKGVV